MKRVLIIDDDDASREILRVALERGGYEVDEAGTAAEAIERVRARRPAAVVSENIVPWPGGECVLDALSDTFARDPVDTIVWTADAFEDVRQRVEARGASFLPKPLALHDVVAEVDRRVGGPHEARRPLELLGLPVA